MKLARVFQDYIVLQRKQPILIWGTSSQSGTVEVKINEKKVCDAEIIEGDFSFTIPAQEAAEDVTIEIGAIQLKHVDIGEVWIAGGQSNMEFMLQYAQGGEEEMAKASDTHLRMYTVGQYSFAGEREEGYKAWNPWDVWLPYMSENAAEMSAVGIYFAKELRKKGIPVGIINCSWGGTSASTWMDKRYLLADKELKAYVDDFEAIVASLDLERYFAIKRITRPGMASKQSKQMMNALLKNTFRPGEVEKMMMEARTSQDGKDTPDNAMLQTTEGLDLTKISIEELLAVGPGDPNEPGVLYENMLKEIIGYSAKGVIWYQGETDEIKATLYAKLFSKMISCWRNAWKEKNESMEKLPFLFVQLAPYGMWRNGTGALFPILRQQQELVSKMMEDVYMTSISDIGNVYDIHPKEKAPIGQRLALLAKKYVYGNTDIGEPDILADAPEAVELDANGNEISIYYKNGRGLYKKDEDFAFYNGFPSNEIAEELLPPVLDGINGLKVLLDDTELTTAECRVEGEVLHIYSDKIRDAKAIRVEFAQTGFYQVNLFNEAGIPVKPFVKEFFVK